MLGTIRKNKNELAWTLHETRLLPDELRVKGTINGKRGGNEKFQLVDNMNVRFDLAKRWPEDHKRWRERL